MKFDWDENKNKINIDKHGISFEDAKEAFTDEKRVFISDIKHSQQEERWFCFGKVGDDIVTVRFTIRGEKIRIFGAGIWNDGRKAYEKENKIY